jgi:hypothetical protein
LWGSYVTAESPHLLTDQTLGKNIYVAAFDKSGNKRVVELGAQNGFRRFQSGMILGIILIICVYLFGKKSPKFSRQ